MTSTQRTESRRVFLQGGLLAVAGLGLNSLDSQARGQANEKKRFEIGLHQFSVKPLFDSGKLDLASYARFVKAQLGITNIEFAADFCTPLLGDLSKADALRKVSESVGVKNRGLLCTGDTALDAPTEEARAAAVRDHVRWARVAERLGCDFMRVRASTEGDPQTQLKNAAAGIGALCEALKSSSLSILVENIAGHTRDPDWLTSLVKRVGESRIALVADFGNFDGDIYDGMQKLLPVTKYICTKSWEFDDEGNETQIDYRRMMQLIKDSGFRGCISIEYLGKTSPVVGIRKTADLIRRYS